MDRPSRVDAASRLVHRRGFLQHAALAPLALTMPHLSPIQARSEYQARSVILVWLWGGPPQIDTFDPKPLASDDVRSPFQPIATRTSGVYFTEVLPRLAARSNRLAVIRSSVLYGNHELVPLTGKTSTAEAARAPNFGSIVAKHRKSFALPAFILITPPGKTSGAQLRPAGVAGPLGSAYDPFVVRCASTGKVELGNFKPLDPGDAARLDERRQLRAQLDSGWSNTSAGSAWDGHWENAYRMLTAPDARRPFELHREPERVRDAYGHTSFGQSLLLSRRLVEAGVPYVWASWSTGVDSLEEGAGQGWDTHYNNFETLANWLAPILDRALSALLDDLHERGLLESTLVVVMGEMGRSPGITSQGGRNHWASGSTLWAGAGVQGGRVVGETDKQAGNPITTPITPLMMGTTIAELAGVNTEARAEMGVLQGGRVIHELF